MERIKELLCTPFYYIKHVVSRFPEREIPIIISGALTLLFLLVRMISGRKELSCCYGSALAFFLGLLLF